MKPGFMEKNHDSNADIRRMGRRKVPEQSSEPKYIA
ncbi:hypothetical protein EPYR_02242 [Erwinia pyrifoliae DSM 12163]|nr:hypothetical protein EPYR_02242 [Erwinia pyrifoliae DSM 12163]